jgi:hypothetical protein
MGIENTEVISSRDKIKVLRPLIDVPHFHDEIECNPDRMYITKPEEHLAGLGIEALTIFDSTPNKSTTKRIVNHYDNPDNLSPNDPSVRKFSDIFLSEISFPVVAAGILGLLYKYQDNYLMAGDVSRGTNMSMGLVSPDLKALQSMGLVVAKDSSCPKDEIQRETETGEIITRRFELFKITLPQVKMINS